MDERLIAWARAVKQRRGGDAPVLWLFTDAARLPDPLAAVARLPRGLCGVVLRHDDARERTRLGMSLAPLCRARRLALVVAGDARLAARLGAGLHCRRGRPPRPAIRRRRGALLTASVHDRAELERACRSGVDIMFISPAFRTLSHPGGPALGPCRWQALARRCGRSRPYALGGINGQTIISLTGCCYGAAAISALNFI